MTRRRTPETSSIPAAIGTNIAAPPRSGSKTMSSIGNATSATAVKIWRNGSCRVDGAAR